MKLVSLSNTSEFLYLTDVNDQQVSAVRVTVPESVSVDETFDEFNSSWPTSDGDTAELHMYYENFNDHMRNRPNGMSEATTIVVDTEDDSDNDDDTNYDNDHENIEEPMYLYIANSAFAFRFGIFVQSVTLMITLRVTFVERKMNHKLVKITLLYCIVILFFFFSFLN